MQGGVVGCNEKYSVYCDKSGLGLPDGYEDDIGGLRVGCKVYRVSTGEKPDVVLGKPDPNMLFGIMDKYGYERDEVAMVGDRIYTDVATAHNAGAFGVLVLSGETTAETVRALESAAASDVSDVSDVSAAECGAVRKGTGENVILPDLTVRDLAELGEWIMFARSRADL